jgi:hypothetical protein
MLSWIVETVYCTLLLFVVLQCSPRSPRAQPADVRGHIYGVREHGGGVCHRHPTWAQRNGMVVGKFFYLLVLCVL